MSAGERGRGRIYQPPGRKVWMLAYYVGPRDARRLVRESAKTDDESKARKRLEQRLRHAQNAVEGIADFEEPAHRRVTVNALFDELLGEYERREIKELDLVRGRLAREFRRPDAKGRRRAEKEKPLRRVFGNRKAAALQTADITNYVNERKAAGYANATINKEVETLRAALALGVRNKRLVRMPAFPKKLKEKNARQGFFETGDFRKILPHLPEPLDDMARFAFERAGGAEC